LAGTLILALLIGCATPNTGGLGLSPGTEPDDVDDAVLEAGAVAEATLALAQLWSVVSGVREVGARVSFTFWSERGALTLMSYTATGRAGPPGQPVSAESLQEGIAKVLTRFAQWRTGAVELTLERQEDRWALAYSTAALARPPEART
jgi:hypothetical protein